MSLVLDTGAMKYRENPNQPWRPLVIKAGMNWESMADTYDPDNGIYEVGRYVLEEGMMYRCIHPIDTPEAWTPAHWIEINIGDELFSLQGSIASEETMRASEDTSIRNTLNQVEDAIAYVQDGDTASRTYTAGQFVYLKNHATLAEGLYTVNSGGIPSDTTVTGHLKADSGGGLNSLLGTVNSNNSVAAPTVSDLNAIAGSNTKIYMCSWDGATLNTPNKQGLTGAGYGYVISMVMEPKNYGVQMAFAVGDKNIFVRLLTGSAWNNWLIVN